MPFQCFCKTVLTEAEKWQNIISKTTRFSNRLAAKQYFSKHPLTYMDICKNPITIEFNISSSTYTKFFSSSGIGTGRVKKRNFFTAGQLTPVSMFYENCGKLPDTIWPIIPVPDCRRSHQHQLKIKIGLLKVFPSFVKTFRRFSQFFFLGSHLVVNVAGIC